ncbi:MAG: MBL fold metallo-hydrolase [Cyclobacteriaceae bacterium]
MKLLKYVLLISFVVSTFQISAQQNYLQKCWNKQVKNLTKEVLVLSFQEDLNRLNHSFEPWQQTNYAVKGKVWCSAEQFLKEDTLVSGQRTYYSKSVFSKSELLLLDYGDKDLFSVTKEMFVNQIFNSARYNPANLINYFVENSVTLSKESTENSAVYSTTINKTEIRLFIDKSQDLLTKITTLSYDDLFGDIIGTIRYSDFTVMGKIYFPKKITISKINGKLEDKITLSNAMLAQKTPTLLEKPANYEHVKAIEKKPEIKTERFNDNIHFVELKHTDDKVMIVEFADFLLVAEAPVNSSNGELIIAEARRIAPGKPLKYFVFGHYHPHYLGGIRPFIHKGAKIITSKMDRAYVTYLADAQHTLQPDSLQLEPAPLLIEEIRDSLSITDGTYEMKIFFIGEKSQHTKDYLIYYFPKEKMLFEDDLVWRKKEGPVQKTNAREVGLYNAVKELGLDVELIIQSWPVSDYGVKTVIPFQELEEAMKIE